MRYAEHTVERLRRAPEVVIYGAGMVGREISRCLMDKPYELKISSFMVSALENNPTEICGIPVTTLAKGKERYRNALVIVAVLERYQEEISTALQREGFTDILPMTFESDLWSQLRGNAYCCYRQRLGKPYLTLEEELAAQETCGDISEVRIYMVKSHMDKTCHTGLNDFSWEIPIQAGAALTDRKIAEIRDDQGDNISWKNRQYCELTALYWIWKHDNARYAGLCHYRRHFNLSQKLLKKLAASDIDVVLTIPILNVPDVRTMYANDHLTEDWDTMLESVRALQPEYMPTIEQFQTGKYYYGYNMLLAKKEVLNDYCSWLFPILARCEERCGVKEDRYQNRYVGFLAERLMSIYFLHNEERYKIVHAQKTFLAE